MKSRLLKVSGIMASILALCGLLGGHWMALQSVAWARMLADFSKTDSFGNAVVKTFNGENPCRMCVGISEGRQQEQSEQREIPLLKTEKAPQLFCESRRPVVPPAPMKAVNAIAFVPQPHSDFFDSPPTPPPRIFLAVL